MLIGHDHPPGRFDAGHCWACAHQADCWTTTTAFRTKKPTSARAREWAWAAHRYAIWALGSSAVGGLLAAAALLTR